MTSQQYKTKQRELILNLLIENKNVHLTADEILDRLKFQGNAVGKSTVYRYLDRLVKQGLIRRYVLEEGTSSCYQYRDKTLPCDSHFHLKCLDCGKLVHLDCTFLQNIEEHVLQEHHFQIDNCKTVFYGICDQCAQNKSISLSLLR